MATETGRDIRVAMVGAGFFAQFHWDSWQRMERAQLVGVCDRDLSRAASTGAPPFDDLGNMLESVQPDLLDIVLPPAAQADAIHTALEHGVQWIICQKPFGTSLAEARALTLAAGDRGAHLVIHENFRFQPWYRTIRQALDKGRIGEVQQASFRLRPGDGQGPRAYLDRQPYFQTMERFLVHETAVHWIDVFRFLFGDPVAVYADLRRLNPTIAGEDAGHILFDHPNGVRSHFDGNRHLDHAADNHRCTMGEAWVEGTKGTLTLRGDGSVWLRAFGSVDGDMILPPDRSTSFGGDCVHALNSHVLAAMLRQGDLENTAEDYLRVLEIEDAVYRSSAEGRKVSIAQGS
ncbi:MAG: Gfo/Idh/MocA family oxidoreductase [Pseudomonadota bacterium]